MRLRRRVLPPPRLRPALSLPARKLPVHSLRVPRLAPRLLWRRWLLPRRRRRLRLFAPQADQWSLHYANARDGALTRPVHGGFHDGRGEFFGEEDLDGKAILVRFVITRAGTDSARFEQAYSQDGGRTWGTNWIAGDTRRSGNVPLVLPWHCTQVTP